MREPNACTAPDEAASDRRVLLVDDDRDFADGLANLLRLENYAVTAVHSAAKAREAAGSAAFPVALIDLRLGHDNGVQLVRELRLIRPELIPVILTAYASLETTIQALQTGAYDYLCKPFYTTDLLATLDRCFERYRLTEDRRRALAELRARNLDLERLNARLTGMLGSVRDLSGAEDPAAAGRRLLGSLVRDLGAAGGALYLASGDTLNRAEAIGEGYRPVLPARMLPVAATMRRDGLDPLMSAGRAKAALLLPLAEGRGQLIGLAVVHSPDPEGFTRTDLELGQILASFGAEVIRSTRANDNLARAEARVRRIIEHSPSAIAFEDPDGNDLLMNDRFRELFPDGVGSPAQGAPLHRLSSRAVTASGRTMTREIEVPGEGGVRRVLMTRFPVFDEGRRPIGVGTIGTDVTERHLAEERLRRAHRLAAMGQLTGGLAHDFNNLLAVVLGNLRLIEEQVRDRPDLLELAGDALDATLSGVELTERLLAVGRSQPLQPEATDLRALVDKMFRLLGRTIGETIAIAVDLAPDLWTVRIDPGQLESSLLNLGINARDAMPEGGGLTIMARNVELGGDHAQGDHGQGEPEVEPGRYVALSVRDSGCGMSAEVRQQALQPFFTTKPAGGGSGLGLSMVYGFVKQSGGHLDIVSDLGRGTTVTLYLPVAPPDALDGVQRRRRAASACGGGHGERILLVEDQARVRLLVRRQLTRLGYEVVDAADAEAALRHLRSPDRIDALITDVILPGPINGVQLCEAALARRPTLAVALTTGYAADVLGERSGRLAEIQVLRKPVDPEILARTLRLAMDRPPGPADSAPVNCALPPARAYSRFPEPS